MQYTRLSMLDIPRANHQTTVNAYLRSQYTHTMQYDKGKKQVHIKRQSNPSVAGR
jgi:hypothetical protein